VQAIRTEDFYARDAWQAPASSQPETYKAPPAPPPDPEPPSARDIERHQELMCVGAGNKAGCERWTSTSGDGAQSTWEGKRGEAPINPH
jgi:hypothetical protein